MAFKKGDVNINRAGRPKFSDKPTSRELKERELLLLARRIKPHVADSILTAARIMKNEEAAHTSQLKAATILLSAYRELILDLYDGKDPDEEATEIQQNSPVFSLKVVENPTKE